MSREDVELVGRPLAVRLIVGVLWRSASLRSTAMRLPHGRLRRTVVSAFVERMYGHINRHRALPQRMFAADFVLTFPRETEFVGTSGAMRGPQAIRQMFEELEQGFDRVHWKVERVSEGDGGRFAVMVRMRAEGGGSGIPVDTPVALVGTFRSGRVARADMYMDRAQALEAVGLSE